MDDGDPERAAVLGSLASDVRGEEVTQHAESGVALRAGECD